MILRIATLCCCLTLILPLVEASAQTRFARPDTTPDYAAYRHADECLAAINRLEWSEERINPVWSDTITSVDTLKYLDSTSDSIVNAAQACLAKFNFSIDTFPRKYTKAYTHALLVANRDEEVESIVMRYKDSTSFIDSLAVGDAILDSYMDAKPARLEKAEGLFNLIQSNIPPDSSGKRLYRRITYYYMASRAGRPALASRLHREILGIYDTLSDTQRQQVTPVGSVPFLFSNLASYLPPEALDSLTVSTDAYRNYLVHLWTLMSGAAAQASAHNDFIALGTQAPQLRGQYWYSNRNGTIEKIAPTIAIDTPAVTIIYFVQGGCHDHYVKVLYGRNNAGHQKCWGEIHKIRRMLEQYPTLQLVVVSKTFGSFADAPPLTPEEEADTLAHYFLGFHKLRGIHVISQTEFFRLPNYDNRIIDSPTENESAYGQIGKRTIDGGSLASHNTVILVDERGKIFHIGSVSGPGGVTADARLKAVMNRAANRRKE